MTKLQHRLETFFAGLLYVAIGTVVATRVSAQSTAQPPRLKPAAAAAVIPALPKQATNCDAKTSPDALCTVAPPASNFKVCFSSKHPRCFEMQKTKLVQSLNGMPAHDAELEPKRAEQLTKAVKDYRSWFESKKVPAPTSACARVITVNLANDHKEFCVSGLPKKELQEKNKAMIDLFEAPPGTLKSTR